MTDIYSANVVAPFTVNTDTLAVEIQAPSSKTVKIRKIRIMHSDGTDTATSDYQRKAQLVFESAAGSGGSSFTPIPLSGANKASGSTVNINSTFFPLGTVSNTIDILSIHSGTDFYWQADSEDDKIVVPAGGIFGVTINPAE